LQQKIIQPGKHAKTTFERLRLRLNRAQPYVEQITRQIVSFVVSGILLPEERLPPSDVAAKQIGVVKDTVVGVYKVLCDHGISSSTPSGTFFTAQAKRQRGAIFFSIASAYSSTMDIRSISTMTKWAGSSLRPCCALSKALPKRGIFLSTTRPRISAIFRHHPNHKSHIILTNER
jgi:DNA-binding transcriptional regulator YhcF (GntR family)